MFTAEQAIEESENGTPIMISIAWATEIITEHEERWHHYDTDRVIGSPTHVDAGDVLLWLGY